MIILVNGSIGEGKDTFCNLFQTHTKYSFENKKFATKLKQVLALLTGCDVKDLEQESFKNSHMGEIWGKEGNPPYTYRKALQLIGTELFRDNFHIHTWSNSILADYRENFSNFLISDWRFVSEGDILTKYFPNQCLKIRIHRKMDAKRWMESKYFKGLNIKNDNLILTDLLSSNPTWEKQKMVEFLQQHRKQLGLDPNNLIFKNLTHTSETELWKLPSNYFDYHIYNDSTLEDFNVLVKEVVAEIEQTFFT